jgi:hypothetical protein
VAARVSGKEANAPFTTTQLRSVECAVAVLKFDDANCFVVVDFPLVSGPTPSHRAAVGNTEAPVSSANPVFKQRLRLHVLAFHDAASSVTVVG